MMWERRGKEKKEWGTLKNSVISFEGVNGNFCYHLSCSGWNRMSFYRVAK